MSRSKILIDDPQKLEAINRYEEMDAIPETDFDEIVKLASIICNAPISLISLLDKERKWLKATVGLNISQSPIEVAFCSYAIQSNEIMIVNDTLEDERFVDNPFVAGDPNIRFYAGMPLISPDGFRLGALCVIDTMPRTLDENQIFALEVLSRQVIQHLELKLHVRDLTKSIGKIHKQNNKLNRLNMVSNKLISIISHDLRNPLTSLKGFIDLSSKKLINKKEQIFFSEGISTLLESSLELMDNLMQWGVKHIEDNKMKIEPIRLDLLINEVVNHLDWMVAQKHNKIINHLNSSYVILGDAVMIRFIVRNLIQNANKFTQRGNIEIIVSQDEDFHTISINDSGIGIASDVISNLFHWDKRVSTHGTKGEKGAGLGLLICNEFIENHHGKICVQSEVGGGSKFSFTLSKNL